MSDRVNLSSSPAWPEVVRSFRLQLTAGHDVVDPATWAGSIPQAHGIAPRVRAGRDRWFNLLWVLPIGFVVLIIAVATAQGLRTIPSVERFIARQGIYYDAHPIEQMRYQLTMLAYDMNGAPVSFGHGAPLRLRNQTQLGFKQVKWIKGVEFVADFTDIGGGYGGYSQDHEFFGYRQSI